MRKLLGSFLTRAGGPTVGAVAPAGRLTLVKRSRVAPAPWTWHLANWLRYRWRELPALAFKTLIARPLGILYVEAVLRLRVAHPDGTFTDYGIVSRRLVTTAGVNYLVDALQGTVEPEILRFHGFGTGTNAEATGDTALQTEETTQYATDNTRPTGSLGEGASANIFRTVATYSPDSGGTRPITEHGILSQAATGGGTLLDRSVFSAVNLVAGADSLQATYDFTIAAGG
jgi:hypothetical protein